MNSKRTMIDIPEWCRKLPKVELHAHLSGSVRPAFLQEQLQKESDTIIRAKAERLLDPDIPRKLSDYFDLFTVIHDLIPDTKTLRSAVLSVLHDFAEENVVYIELRTTPREAKHMTAEQYLKTVLETVVEYHRSAANGLVCRVLVSISRHLPTDWAWDTLKLTERILETAPPEIRKLIVGMEFSGNPLKGKWEDFRPIFEHAQRNLGLAVSLHFAEVQNDEEALAMLRFKPDRVGHAVLMSPAITDQLLKQEPKIGVEVCITSNLVTNSVISVSEHPVTSHFFPLGHPFCLCTDDAGVFDTSLSKEFAHFAAATGIDESVAREITHNALGLAFCKDNSIEQVRMKIAEQL